MQPRPSISTKVVPKRRPKKKEKRKKWGNLNTKKSVTIFHVLHKDETLWHLRNTFLVTITQDDSKMQNDNNMHTWLKLEVLSQKKSPIKMMDLEYSYFFKLTFLSYLIYFFNKADLPICMKSLKIVFCLKNLVLQESTACLQNHKGLGFLNIILLITNTILYPCPIFPSHPDPNLKHFKICQCNTPSYQCTNTFNWNLCAIVWVFLFKKNS